MNKITCAKLKVFDGTLLLRKQLGIKNAWTNLAYNYTLPYPINNANVKKEDWKKIFADCILPSYKMRQHKN